MKSKQKQPLIPRVTIEPPDDYQTFREYKAPTSKHGNFKVQPFRGDQQNIHRSNPDYGINPKVELQSKVILSKLGNKVTGVKKGKSKHLDKNLDELEDWNDSGVSMDSEVRNDHKLMLLKQDIRQSNLRLKLESQKNLGILPENFFPIDIKISFSAKLHRDIDVPNEKQADSFLERIANKPIAELIVISLDNKYYALWKTLEIVINLMSSYFYAYIAAFKVIKYGDSAFNWMVFYESFFLISLLLKFLVSFIPDGQTIPVKDIAMIAERYIKGNLVEDLIPLLPLPFLPLGGIESHLYFIKIMRLTQAFKLFNIQRIMAYIIDIHKLKIEILIKHDERVAEETNKDINQISTLLLVNFGIRIGNIGLLILTICYFLGLGWYIFCDVLRDIQEPYYETKTEEELMSLNTDNYVEYYNLEDYSATHRTIASMYYAFTTLSTVGFGDLAPRSNIERMVCSFILMFGVSIFSYFMGNFIEILTLYQNLNADLDEGDELTKFFAMMEYFNTGLPIEGDPTIQKPLKLRIEEHFNYKWNNDQTSAVSTEADQLIFHQVPQDVQNKLLCNFLFNKFLKNFSDSYFRIPKNVLDTNYHPGPRKTSQKIMTFDDPLYQQFMTELLLNLEPRQEPEGTIIFHTNEETNEMFFVNRGSVDVGFELNNQVKYCIRLQPGGVVGAYNCTYSRKTTFIYVVQSMFQGYTIRKLNWLKILKNPEYEAIAECVKTNVREEYQLRIKNRVLLEQSKYIKKLKERKDQNQILALINLDTFQPIISNVKQEFADEVEKKAVCCHELAEFEQVKAFYKNCSKLKKYTKKIGLLLETFDSVNKTNIELHCELQKAHFELFKIMKKKKKKKLNRDNTPQDVQNELKIESEPPIAVRNESQHTVQNIQQETSPNFYNQTKGDSQLTIDPPLEEEQYDNDFE